MSDLRTLFENFLNSLIEEEFEIFVNVNKHERSEKRFCYRNGYRVRQLNTALGTVSLKIPRTREASFMPSFLEKYQRSTEELEKLVQSAYVNGVSTGNMSRLLNTLGVQGVSKSQVSRLTNRLKEDLEVFRKRPLKDAHFDALFIDATYEKIRVNGHVKPYAILVVIGCTKFTKEIIAIEPLLNESKKSYKDLLQGLKARGLKIPKLLISDCAAGLLSATPKHKHQRCKVHFLRNVMQHLNKKGKRKLAKDLRHIYHTHDKKEALKRAQEVYDKHSKRYPKAMECLMNGIQSTLTYLSFKRLPSRISTTTNPIERINKEFKRRTKPIEAFCSIDACIKVYTLIALKRSL